MLLVSVRVYSFGKLSGPCGATENEIR